MKCTPKGVVFSCLSSSACVLPLGLGSLMLQAHQIAWVYDIQALGLWLPALH